MITKALLLKGIAGVSAVTSAVAVGWKFDSIRNFLNGRVELTKWDKALIEAIDKEENSNINFSLSSGSNSPLDNFPSFADSTGENPKTQEASITFSFSASDQTYNDANEKLKKLNRPNEGAEGDGTAWTWECTVKFMRSKTTESTQPEMKDEDKNKVFKNNTEGLLWKISQNNNKDEKKKVIELCAKERTENKNLESLKGLSEKNNKISSTVVFTSTVEQNNLVFGEEKFKEWFN